MVLELQESMRKKYFDGTEEVGPASTFYLNDSAPELEPFFLQTQWKMAIKFIESPGTS